MKIAFAGFDLMAPALEALVQNNELLRLFTCRVDGVYETNDGYWLVNFVCDKGDTKKYEAKFLDWAGKVTFK